MVVCLPSDIKSRRPPNALRTCFREYVRALDAAAPRFCEPHGAHLPFAWRDAGSARGRQTHATVAAERAVALFALAAAESGSAAAEDRSKADGIRRACAALCDAAGALRAAAEGGHMSSECMAALEALECFFEVAVAGGKPLALCSKVAQQVSLDYDKVHCAITPPEAERHQIDKSWPAHVQAKSAYFRAEACLRAARALREKGDEVGEAIARLRQGLASLEGAKGPIKKAAARLRTEMEADLAAAERDNCRIYYMRVPTAAALAELPGLPQPLVRPTPVEKILQLQGPRHGGESSGLG